MVRCLMVQNLLLKKIQKKCLGLHLKVLNFIDARSLMEKTDKSRAAYYNYYTNKTWGMASSYNFSIDVSVLGLDETVAFIKGFVEHKMNQRPPHFG